MFLKNHKSQQKPRLINLLYSWLQILLLIFQLRKDAAIEPTSKGTDIQHTITGTFNVPSQYHYTMETQSCTTQVTENGLVVRSSTQWMDLVHVAVSKALNIDENRYVRLCLFVSADQEIILWI